MNFFSYKRSERVGSCVHFYECTLICDVEAYGVGSVFETITAIVSTEGTLLFDMNGKFVFKTDFGTRLV
jgi:hypothetical protein